MPRIRRFHPISHEFNRDPEVRELRRLFGDWMALVWQEMLAIGDKNLGRIKGDTGSIARSLAHVSLSNRPEYATRTILTAFPYMADKGWIDVRTDAVFICNYGDYHKTKEHKESHAGTKEAPSFLPSLPSFLPKDKKAPKGALSSRAEMTPVELMESWNEICGSEGLPRLEEFTNGRQTTARRRLKRYPKVEFWGRVFNGIVDSDYLMGRKRKEGDTWKPDFDWLMKNDENPAKVVEGKYA